MRGSLKTSVVIAILLAGSIAAQAAMQGAAGDASFAPLYRSAQAAMAAGRYDEARASFERLEKMDPSVAEVHATLGALCYKAGDFDRAIEEIHAARKLKPELSGLDALLSLSLAESGKSREALPGLEKAFHAGKDPEVKRQAGLELAHVYAELSMDRRAAETALELRDTYKDDPEVLYNAGKILGNSAYLTMQDLFHGAGGSLWAQLAEADAHESQGQFADAISGYRKVLEIDPRHVNVHYRMGRTYLTQWQSSHADQDLAAAEAEFANEIEVNPGNANAAYELAGLRWKHGDDASAEHLYESAIRFYPNFEEAEVGLAGILLEEQKPTQAAAHLQKATALRKDDEVAWYRLAMAERQLGDANAQRLAMAEFQKLRSHSASSQSKAATAQSQDSVTPQELGSDAKQE